MPATPSALSAAIRTLLAGNPRRLAEWNTKPVNTTEVVEYYRQPGGQVAAPVSSSMLLDAAESSDLLGRIHAARSTNTAADFVWAILTGPAIQLSMNGSAWLAFDQLESDGVIKTAERNAIRNYYRKRETRGETQFGEVVTARHVQAASRWESPKVKPNQRFSFSGDTSNSEVLGTLAFEQPEDGEAVAFSIVGYQPPKGNDTDFTGSLSIGAATGQVTVSNAAAINMLAVGAGHLRVAVLATTPKGVRVNTSFIVRRTA